jgi:hypothetical protein
MGWYTGVIRCAIVPHLAFRSISLYQAPLRQRYSSQLVRLTRKAVLVCNTTTNQLIELDALGVIDSLSVNADVFTQSYNLAFTLLNSSEPLNITEVVTLWYLMLVTTLGVVAPTDLTTILLVYWRQFMG